MNTEQFRTAGQRLSSWQRTMLLTHDRPDGDALGACAGMHRVITSLGRAAEVFVYGEVPPRYAFLEGEKPFTLWNAKDAAALDDAFDGILILDTCSWAQLEPAAPYLRQSRLPRIVVDHHATRDDVIAGSGGEYLIDPHAASACGLLYEWCRLMGWPLDTAACAALFTGIATDTGWFRFSNTDERTLTAAGALVGAGLRPDIMFARLMESYSQARLRLMGQILSTLEFHAGGTVALMSATQAMFAASGATASDTEDIVNEPMGVADVGISVLLSEGPDGVIRVNLRSKSPEIFGRDLDVSAVAKGFGGGGHRRAAGARIPGSLAGVRERVLGALMTSLAIC